MTTSPRLLPVLAAVLGGAALTLPTAPASAAGGLELSVTSTPDQVRAGDSVSYAYVVQNSSESDLASAKVTVAVDAGASYVSATCGGTWTASTRTVTFRLGTLAAESARTCRLQMRAGAGDWTRDLLSADFGSSLDGFTASHDEQWAAFDWFPTEGTAYAIDPAEPSDQFLTSVTPATVRAGDTLAFTHSYDLEDGFDGGVVEVSTDDGASFVDIGSSSWVQGGYDGALASSQDNPLADRFAFTGTRSSGRSVADLSAYAGQDVLIRFRLGSDAFGRGTGWSVDDVALTHHVATTATATATATGGSSATVSSSTDVTAPSGARPDRPVVTGTTGGAGSASVAFTPGNANGSEISSFGLRCTSPDGGITRAVTVPAGPTASPAAVTGLSLGKSYRCRVRATNAVGTSADSLPGPLVVAAGVPAAPTVTGVAAGPARSVTVSFTAGSDGGDAITGYTARCASPGRPTRTIRGAGSPLTVRSLTSGATYRCSVRAENGYGSGAWSAPSAPVVAS